MRTVASADFRFEIEEAFTLAGRQGCAVVGQLTAGSVSHGDTLYLHTPTDSLRVDGVMLVIAGELTSLQLPKVTKDQVPSGSILLAR
jgi:selenocysteine-specific translation elongation factor